MDVTEQLERLEQARRPLGGERRSLVLGHLRIGIDGLSTSLCRNLERRWGGFLQPCIPADPHLQVRLFRGGPGLWIDAPKPGEPYRIESLVAGSRRLVASYHFAIAPDPDERTWRVGLADDGAEPEERVVDNVLRVLTARLAVEQGGFAMHSAAVLHDGRAWLFAGASGSGKSTVVALLAPAPSLGDDFGLVLPVDGHWCAPALPFDNSEAIRHTPPEGLFPVAGIWRLHQADRTHVVPPPRGRSVTSLVGCTAFPWALPELSEAVLEHVERFVGESSYLHLHFTRRADLWSVLV